MYIDFVNQITDRAERNRAKAECRWGFNYPCKTRQGEIIPAKATWRALHDWWTKAGIDLTPILEQLPNKASQRKAMRFLFLDDTTAEDAVEIVEMLEDE